MAAYSGATLADRVFCMHKSHEQQVTVPVQRIGGCADPTLEAGKPCSGQGQWFLKSCAAFEVCQLEGWAAN